MVGAGGSAILSGVRNFRTLRSSGSCSWWEVGAADLKRGEAEKRAAGRGTGSISPSWETDISPGSQRASANMLHLRFCKGGCHLADCLWKQHAPGVCPTQQLQQAGMEGDPMCKQSVWWFRQKGDPCCVPESAHRCASVWSGWVSLWNTFFVKLSLALILFLLNVLVLTWCFVEKFLSSSAHYSFLQQAVSTLWFARLMAVTSQGNLQSDSVIYVSPWGYIWWKSQLLVIIGLLGAKGWERDHLTSLTVVKRAPSMIPWSH